MKKSLWLILLLSLVCGFVLSSCNNENDEPSNNDLNQSTNGEQNTDKEEDESEEEVVCQHFFEDWTVEKQATCKEVGVLTRNCTKCSETEETTIAKNNIHTEVIDSALVATCENTGLTEGKHCSVCEKVLVEQIEIPLKAHTYDDKYDETCNNCDYVRNAECAHLETETLEGKASTCTSAGLTEGSKCKKCGEILIEQKVVPELGHTYTSVVTAPTCTEQGYTTYTCICTGSYVDDYVNANGHSEVIDEAIEPTINSTGFTEGKHCSTCGAILVKQEIVPALLSVSVTCEEGLTIGGLKASYLEGESVSITVTIADNYRFDGWYIDGIKKSSDLTYTFTMPESNVTITLKSSEFFDPSSKITANKWNGTIASGFAGGSGSKDDPYLISTGAQLAYFAKRINSVDISRSYFRLTNSINLNGREWTPIGNNSYSSSSSYSPQFRGNFDGNGYIVYNYKINVAQSYGYTYYGLFGYLGAGSTVKNLGVEDLSINIAQAEEIYAGGLAGWASNAKITNCYAIGKISASATQASNSYTKISATSGGLIGKCHTSSINNCSANVEVYSEDYYSASYSGGLVGWYGYSDITNSYATGNVKSELYAGGLVAYAYDATFTNSYSTSNVTINDSRLVYPGGLVGKAEKTSVTDCYATGDIVSSYWAGGLIAEASGECSLINSYATGNVYAEEDAGGFIAYSGVSSIDNCYSTGDVQGGYWCGGFIGKNNNSSSTITNCYSTGNVIYHDYYSVGGFIGYNLGNITNCYSTGNVSCTTSCDFNTINVGGFIGNAYSGNIKNCFATGNVTVTHGSTTSYLYVGGFLGNNNSSTVTNCYRYEGQTIDVNISYSSNSYGTKCTVGQLNLKTFYTSILKWDSEIWSFDNLNFNNKTTPLLRLKK